MPETLVAFAYTMSVKHSLIHILDIRMIVYSNYWNFITV